jgi:diaminopimelate decarboxylase
MPLNDSIRFVEGVLHVDSLPAAEIADALGTPVYIYSIKRALANLRRIQDAFAHLDAHIHYSAKANANLSVLRSLIGAGAGVDAVSGGEIYKALKAGAKPQDIVFAGVGKSPEDIRFALEKDIGWFNVENVAELTIIDRLANALGRDGVKIALRLNPDVTAATHPHIATGHGGAKFGLTADEVRDLLAKQAHYPHLTFAGLHVHIGSQLHDTSGTQAAVRKALDLIASYPDIRTLNIGGGFPASYNPAEALPLPSAFAEALAPLVEGYTLLLEPGRSIIADAGLLVTRLLYIKQQGGQTFYIVDAGMNDLIRPALYEAVHTIVPLNTSASASAPVNVVGPVCETADVLGKQVPLPPLQPDDLLAVLTAGAYGMVMASTYNARPRPAEVVVHADGSTWSIARPRESWEDLVRAEQELPAGP